VETDVGWALTPDGWNPLPKTTQSHVAVGAIIDVNGVEAVIVKVSIVVRGLDASTGYTIVSAAVSRERRVTMAALGVALEVEIDPWSAAKARPVM
jgi:hypothetical protein